MATWFATANGNIDSAGRWNSAPDGSGSTLTWPPAQGDVLVSNGYVPIINVSTDLGSGAVRSDAFEGGAAGGYFDISTGVTLTANVHGGNVYGVYVGNSKTVTIVGDVYADNSSFTGNRYSVQNGTSTLNIVGNLYGGTGGLNSRAVRQQFTGTLNITGNLYGYGLNNREALLVSGAGSVNITGDVVGDGGNGILSTVSSNITVTGNAISLSTTAILHRGTLSVSGYAQASNSAQAIAEGSTAMVTVIVGETRSAANGRGAVTGPFRYASATAAKSQPIIAGAQQTLSVLDVAALVPDEADVRAGVTYGDGAYTGTLALQRKRASMAGRF